MPAATPLPETQTLSPEMSGAYAKKRKIRAVRAGLRMFIPVPPKISLPTTTPKAMPRATCQSGMSGGSVSGKSSEVTRNPSLISCFARTAEKIASSVPPTMIVTA